MNDADAAALVKKLQTEIVELNNKMVVDFAVLTASHNSAKEEQVLVIEALQVILIQNDKMYLLSLGISFVRILNIH